MQSPDPTFRDEPPDAAAYHRLFETTGWNDVYRQDPEALLSAVRASWFVTCAYLDDELVAVGRLLSDGRQYAVVFDMIVEPRLQGRGVGTAVMERLLARCEAAGIRDVLLFAAEGTPEFYRRFGFRTRPPSAPGMILRRTPDGDAGEAPVDPPGRGTG